MKNILLRLKRSIPMMLTGAFLLMLSACAPGVYYADSYPMGFYYESPGYPPPGHHKHHKKYKKYKKHHKHHKHHDRWDDWDDD